MALCKLDMEKAYDNVNWSFVNYMLQRMSFGEKWRWIKVCTTTTSFRVLVNGDSTSSFKTFRGLS